MEESKIMQVQPESLEDLQKRMVDLSNQLKNKKKLINVQRKTITELESTNESKKIKNQLEDRKRALIIAKQKFEFKKMKFYQEELPSYEDKIIKMGKQFEAEEVKKAPTMSAFEQLMKEVTKLCKCHESGTLMKNPTSIPSGNLYDKNIANSIMRGRYKKLNELKQPNMLRGDRFTSKLISIVEKYQKANPKIKK